MSRAASSVSAHLALGAACVVGCWTGAALDQLHDGGLLWRSLCLVPGWPTPQQLGLRLQLMPLSALLTMALPTLVWALLPRPRRLLPLLICLGAAVMALMPAIYVCRLSTDAGWHLNETLPGMLLLESMLMVGVHASLSRVPVAARSLPAAWRRNPVSVAP